MADKVDDDLPMSLTIRSDDLPDPAPDPSWHRPEPVERCLDSATFDHDDPAGLRSRGPVAVASALLLLSRWGRYAPWRAVREAAALLERYLTGNLSAEGLEFALGLRRSTGGSGLALKAKVAARDALLVRLAQRAPWAGMGPWSAARAMRASFAAYERNRYPGHSSRGTRPAGDDETWWLILQLKLSSGSMPKERRCAELIGKDR
jgi:hypothetical protein